MRSISALTVLCITLCLQPMVASSAKPDKTKRVLVISIDGLGYEAFQKLRKYIPTLSNLAKQGVLASSETIFPSMTWPSHASLVTGCKPSKHRILGNRVFDRRSNKVVHASTVPYKDTFHVPTIFDLAHAQGLKSAAILWPSTREAESISFNIPEVYGQKKFAKWSTKAWLKQLKKRGLPTHRLGKFSEDQMFLQDTFARDAAIDLIENEPPELLMVHFLSVDSLGHTYGPNSRPYRWGLELVDRYVSDLLRALEKRKIAAETNVVIVSDHGFLSIKKRFDADKLLYRAGYIKSLKKLDKGPVRTVSNGHALFIYLRKKERKTVRAKLRTLLMERDEVEKVFTPRHYRQLGLPTPGEDTASPDLIALSKPSVIFGRIKRGDELVARSRIPGMHGYLPSHPQLRPVFIAHGPDLKSFTETNQDPPSPWLISNLDVAPTLAKLLGLVFSSPVDGKVLDEILAP